MTKISKRKRHDVDTERQKAKRASAGHLRDLRAAHAHPPADVKLASSLSDLVGREEFVEDGRRSAE
jgi:hypothetical protein